MQEEIWKDIPIYEGIYQVSNLGNVKSLNYKKSGKSFNLKLNKSSNGYLTVSLCKNRIKKTFTIHNLVAITFLNHNPNGFKGLVIDHINNIKTDNRLVNLILLTQRENTSKQSKGSSKYIGVSLCKKRKLWTVSISINNKKKYLGAYKNEMIASSVYQYELDKYKSSRESKRKLVMDYKILDL